jgi:hypothetical protein
VADTVGMGGSYSDGMTDAVDGTKCDTDEDVVEVRIGRVD